MEGIVKEIEKVLACIIWSTLVICSILFLVTDWPRLGAISGLLSFLVILDTDYKWLAKWKDKINWHLIFKYAWKGFKWGSPVIGGFGYYNLWKEGSSLFWVATVALVILLSSWIFYRIPISRTSFYDGFGWFLVFAGVASISYLIWLSLSLMAIVNIIFII